MLTGVVGSKIEAVNKPMSVSICEKESTYSQQKEAETRKEQANDKIKYSINP